ncbi:MAG TPA: ATP-binding protein, partial [Chloroflexota bacterium]
EQVEARVDPIRFEQVITNLLNNAVKFSPKGGVVLVDLRRTEDNQARLSVTDQGIGIPAEERDLVFDRFQQANGVRHLSGLGLGLYITREIVELHHGSIWIEQPNHPGTRFVVTVPLTGSGV